MFLVLLSALLGAYMGLTRPGKLMAVATSGALAGTAHLCLQLLAAWMLDAADDRSLARRLVDLLDLGAPLWRPVAAALIMATLAAVFATIGAPRQGRGVYLADSGEWRPEQRRKPRRPRTQGLNDGAARPIGEMLNR